MVVDYRQRGAHVVRCLVHGLEFQVLTYGVPDPGPRSLAARLSSRGYEPEIYEHESRLVTDKFNHSRGRGRGPGIHHEQPRRHFFNRRIDVPEALQDRADARDLGARDGASGQGSGDQGEAQERRGSGDDQGER